MQREAAFPTPKQRPRPAVGTGRMPATATPLRGMPGIDPSHRTTLGFRLVRDEGFHLREGPAVQPALLLGLPLRLDAAANVGEVFEDDRAARRRGLDNLLAQDVIAIPTKAGLPVAHAAQVPLGALCSGLLQGTAQLEVPAFGATPTFPSQKGIGARDGWLRQAEVHSHRVMGRDNARRGQLHHDMQPPRAITPNQISRAGGMSGQWQRIVGHGEGDRHAPLRRRQADLLRLPVNLVRVQVVARRAGCCGWGRDLATAALQDQRTLHGLGRFDAGLDVQVADQAGSVGFTGVVSGVVQPDPVPFLVCPSIRTHRVKRLRKELRRFRQRGRLLRCRLEFDAYRSVHTKSIPYTVRFCQLFDKTGGSALSSVG